MRTKEKRKKIKVILTIRDSRCPKCKYPEILLIRGVKDGHIFGEQCPKSRTSDYCDYFVLYGDSQ